MQETRPASTTSLRELAALFLKLGTFGFGGPAVHLALLEEEVVRRRGWFSRERFLDFVGATNLIPGPNSTEMAIHVGLERGGWKGLLVAGGSFIAPAAAITMAFAWAYVEFGSLPEVTPFLAGIKPAVIAVIAGALYRLGNTALKSLPLVVVALSVAMAGMLTEVNEAILLVVGGLLGMCWLRSTAPGSGSACVRVWLGGLSLAALPSALGVRGTVALAAAAAGRAASPDVFPLWKLGLFFLKVGAVLYGTGYVLVAFLEGGLAYEGGPLSRQELLDAVAMGQFTPGPLLSTATFIGYQMDGPLGAAVATVAIFLPSFVFVALLNPVLPRLRRLAWSASFLDAINASAVALMVVVTLRLGRDTLFTSAGREVIWPAWGIALVAVAVHLRYRKISPALLILGGALLGWLLPGWTEP